MNKRPPPTPMERAMRMLAVRGHSSSELLTKLRRAEIPQKTAEATVLECQRLGFINDEVFADDCAKMLANRGCGKLKIKANLYRRGITELDDNLVEELEESELERAIEAARFKLRLISRESDPRKKREKLWRFLIGRGFTFDTVREASEQLFNEHEQINSPEKGDI